MFHTTVNSVSLAVIQSVIGPPVFWPTYLPLLLFWSCWLFTAAFIHFWIFSGSSDAHTSCMGDLMQSDRLLLSEAVSTCILDVWWLRREMEWPHCYPNVPSSQLHREYKSWPVLCVYTELQWEDFCRINSNKRSWHQDWRCSELF